MSEMLLLVCVGCSIFSLISGLTLSSNGSFITTDAFYLVCDVQGTITSSITIIDPARSTAGLCLAPPLNCIPVTGNTMERDVAKGTVKIGIGKPNIQLPASEGSWSCTDGTVSHSFVVKIHSYTQPVIQTEEEVPITGTIITVLIGCIYPYPDEVKISYVKKTARNIVLKSQNEVKFDNGTSTNCPVPDTRAISMNGTFLLSTDNLNGKEALIAVAVFLNGIQLGSTGYSNFSILSEKGLATPASTNNTDMSTNNTDMSTTVSEATAPPVNTSATGLSQEIVITIIISSIFAVGGLVLLIALVFRQCRQKNTEILAENKESHFVNEQGNMTKKDDLKSNKPRKSLFSDKRNIKRRSSSLDKKKKCTI